MMDPHFPYILISVALGLLVQLKTQIWRYSAIYCLKMNNTNSLESTRESTLNMTLNCGFQAFEHLPLLCWCRECDGFVKIYLYTWTTWQRPRYRVRKKPLSLRIDSNELVSSWDRTNHTSPRDVTLALLRWYGGAL